MLYKHPLYGTSLCASRSHVPTSGKVGEKLFKPVSLGLVMEPQWRRFSPKVTADMAEQLQRGGRVSAP